jgi:undecaprenyl-diphosphatase
MSFTETVIDWDKQLLLAINQFHSIWTDQFFLLVSGHLLPILLGIALLLFLFKDNGVNTFWYLLFLALAIALSDTVSSTLLKPLVARLRPTHDPTIMNLLHIVNNYKGGLYGFVSSHAANTFAAAMFMSLLLRKRSLGIVVFLWAALTSYSRIYLGVHFPLDVLGGIVVGLISGSCSYLLMRLLAHFIFKKRKIPVEPYFPNREQLYFVCIAIASLILIIGLSFNQ